MEEVLAKREAALKEERAALLATRTLTTEAVVSSEADAGVVQKVQIVEEPADLKIEQREAVIPAENQTDYVPKRPAVFDGRGNAPVVTNKSSTNGAEPQLLYFNDPSFATGRTPSTDATYVRLCRRRFRMCVVLRI